MKKVLAALFVSTLAAAVASAQTGDINRINPHAQQFQAKGAGHGGGGGGSSNLIYHTGGTVIQSAHVVDIFWGASTDFPSGYATELQAYRDHYGSTNQYNVITQYYDSANGNIVNANLGAYGDTADWLDTANPLPASGNVTDALVQCEVQAYFLSSTATVTCADGSVKHGSGLGYAVDYSAIYEVFLPASHNGTSVYSSSGSSDSCGGPNLAYCAYHSHYGSGSTAVKYSIEPFASCSGCSTSGWSATQNQEHFISHETREAVTDELGNAWFDRRGYEADDKCAWSPTPFLVPTGTYTFGYQYEWSNHAGGCVQATTSGGTVTASPN